MYILISKSTGRTIALQGQAFSPEQLENVENQIDTKVSIMEIDLDMEQLVTPVIRMVQLGDVIATAKLAQSGTLPPYFQPGRCAIDGTQLYEIKSAMAPDLINVIFTLVNIRYEFDRMFVFNGLTTELEPQLVDWYEDQVQALIDFEPQVVDDVTSLWSVALPTINEDIDEWRRVLYDEFRDLQAAAEVYTPEDLQAAAMAIANQSVVRVELDENTVDREQAIGDALSSAGFDIGAPAGDHTEMSGSSDFTD